MSNLQHDYLKAPYEAIQLLAKRFAEILNRQFEEEKKHWVAAGQMLAGSNAAEDAAERSRLWALGYGRKDENGRFVRVVVPPEK